MLAPGPALQFNVLVALRVCSILSLAESFPLGSTALNAFIQELDRRLDALRNQGLWRELRRVDSRPGAWIKVEGRRLLNFSSNDYLGLAAHPALREAAARAAVQIGAGAGASRLICGSLAPCHELEAVIARFKGLEAVLTFATGYTAALGAVTTLAGTGDVVILDKLAHASLVDAARLSGAKLRVFAHNDLADLEGILDWARRYVAERTPPGHVLIVTESVFSMDGDLAPLRALVDLKDRFGAWLLVDEAHATGVFGEQGRGLVAAAGLTDRVEVHLGTLGKALGAAGGFIGGARELVELLVNRARPFIFSTAPVPAAVAAARAGVELAAGARGDTLRAQLWQRVRELRAALAAAGWSLPADESPILPLVVGEEAAAVQLAAKLREAGFFVPAIRYPTVARGAARLRLTVSAAHTAWDVAQLYEALTRLSKPTGIRKSEARNQESETGS